MLLVATTTEGKRRDQPEHRPALAVGTGDAAGLLMVSTSGFESGRRARGVAAARLGPFVGARISVDIDDNSGTEAGRKMTPKVERVVAAQDMRSGTSRVERLASESRRAWRERLATRDQAVVVAA